MLELLFAAVWLIGLLAVTLTVIVLAGCAALTVRDRLHRRRHADGQVIQLGRRLP